MTVEEQDQLVELMKEAFDSNRDIRRLVVTVNTGRDAWRTITVREPSLWEENGDIGLVVVVEDGSL